MKEQHRQHVVRRSTPTAPAPTTAPIGEVYISGYRDAVGTAQLPLNTWTHLAATYNGSVLALYVNGVQAGQLAHRRLARRRRPARCSIGGNTDLGRVVPGRHRRGPHLQPRPHRHRDPGRHEHLDHEPGLDCRRSAPGALVGCRAGLSSASLSWGAATDNVGVVRYNVHRGTSAGFTPSAGEPDRAADRARATPTPVCRGRLLLPGRGRGRGRQCRAVLERGVGDGRRHARAVGAGDAVCGRVRSGGRRSRGRRRPTTSVWCATTSTAARSAGFTPGAGQPDRAADQRPATSTRPLPAATSTRSPPRTRPATSAPPRNEASATVHRRHDRAERTDRARRDRSSAAPSTSAGPARTDDVAVTRYNVHRGTTAGFTPSAAQPDRAADRARATPTPASRPAATSTRSPPRTPPATSAPPRTRPAPPSPTRPRPAHPARSPPPPPAARSTSAWGAATDNVAVSRYNLHRGTTSGFTPSTANRIAQPTGLSYADTGLAPGTYFYKLTAEDAAGNIGPVSATPPPPPSPTPAHPAPPRLTATGGAGQTSSQLDRRHRQRRRHPLQPPPLAPAAASPPAPPTGSRNPPAPATPTPASPPAPTTTSSPPKTPPATSAPPQQPGAPPPSPHPPSPASSPPTASTPAPAPRSPTNPAPATTARSPTPPGPAPARQIRQRPHLQRHQRHRHHPRHQPPRPHHRHDPRSLGQADQRSERAGARRS